MNALPKHGGNYSCIAENQAGVTQLFIPVSIVGKYNLILFGFKYIFESMYAYFSHYF